MIRKSRDLFTLNFDLVEAWRPDDMVIQNLRTKQENFAKNFDEVMSKKLSDAKSDLIKLLTMEKEERFFF